MMSEPKPIASLSSGLLARKGQAKPAMRPQGFAGFGMAQAMPHDDLGWNDMGHDHAPQSFPTQQHASPHAATPQPISDNVVPMLPEDAEPPHVVRQMADLARSLTPAEPAKAAPVVEPLAENEIKVEAPVAVSAPVVAAIAKAPRAAAGSKPKAAFTLRLDSERHLKLRLVCAVRHRSAQAVVLAALDAFLDTQPGIGELTRAAAGEVKA